MIDSSLLLESINSNSFLLFPDKYFYDGTDGKTNFNTFQSMIKQNEYPIEDIKKNSSYTIWKYSGKDDKELYSRNLKRQSDDWYYKNNFVNYTLNSFGYRTKNFTEIDWGNSIVIFGCSQVLGVGVDDSHTLSSFLEKELNTPVVNMGVSGSSNEFHLYNSNILLTQYPKPKVVIYALTGLQRHSFYHWDYVEHRGSWNDTSSQIKNNRSNSIMRSIISSNTMSNIWSSNTTYVEYTTEFYAYTFLNKLHKNLNRYYLGTDKELKDFARDMIHPGKKSNEILAKSLAKILKSRLT